MRARALFAFTVGMLLVAIAIPAAAKPQITKAQISGPGLVGGDLRISGRAARDGTWDSGLDLFGDLDNAMASSIAELGLTAVELGPRYVVRYRFNAGPAKPPEFVRQQLYPYAKGGPVTYTPPGQRLFGSAGMTITAGWYRSLPEFFHYLVDEGLPGTNPVVGADRDSAPHTVPAARPMPWGWMALALVGLVAVPVAAPRLGRCVLAVARAHR